MPILICIRMCVFAAPYRRQGVFLSTDVERENKIWIRKKKRQHLTFFQSSLSTAGFTEFNSAWNGA